jgi:hypothetical protein
MKIALVEEFVNLGERPVLAAYRDIRINSIPRGDTGQRYAWRAEIGVET